MKQTNTKQRINDKCKLSLEKELVLKDTEIETKQENTYDNE